MIHDLTVQWTDPQAWTARLPSVVIRVNPYADHPLMQHKVNLWWTRRCSRAIGSETPKPKPWIFVIHASLLRPEFQCRVPRMQWATSCICKSLTEACIHMPHCDRRHSRSMYCRLMLKSAIAMMLHAARTACIAVWEVVDLDLAASAVRHLNVKLTHELLAGLVRVVCIGLQCTNRAGNRLEHTVGQVILEASTRVLV